MKKNLDSFYYLFKFYGMLIAYFLFYNLAESENIVLPAPIDSIQQIEPKKCDYSKLKLPPQCVIKTDEAYSYPFVVIECENIFSTSDWCKKNDTSPACKAKKVKLFNAACNEDGSFKDNIAFSNIFGKLIGFGSPEGCDTPRFENGYIALDCMNQNNAIVKETYKTPLFFSPFFKFKQIPHFLNVSGSFRQIYLPENCLIQDTSYSQGVLSVSCLNSEKSIKYHKIPISFENSSSKLATTFFEKDNGELLTVLHPYECLLKKNKSSSDMYVSCEPDQDVNIKAYDPDQLIKERKFFQLFTSENTSQILITRTEDQQYHFWDIPGTCDASDFVLKDKKLKIRCFKDALTLKSGESKMNLEMPIAQSFGSQNICRLNLMEDLQKEVRLSAACNRGVLANLLPQKCLSKSMKLENNIMTISCYDKNTVLVQNTIPIICDCSGNPIDTITSVDETGILVLKKVARSS